MKFRTIAGWLGLKAAEILPDNSSRIPMGQQAVRGFFAGLFLEQCGKNVNVHRHTSFSHTCHLGDRSGIGKNSVFYGPVWIGDDVLMGTDCLIYTRNHEYRDPDVRIRLQGPQPVRRVTIGDDVWIGGRVTILPGVSIGTGAVIGAGSVVTRDIPPYAVAAGNPARVVKTRSRESGSGFGAGVSQ